MINCQRVLKDWSQENDTEPLTGNRKLVRVTRALLAPPTLALVSFIYSVLAAFTINPMRMHSTPRGICLPCLLLKAISSWW
jgi:hypothetical protein